MDIEETTPIKEEFSEEPDTSETGETSQSDEKFKVGDKEYTADEIEELNQIKDDYNHLLPEFTRKSQRLADLEKQSKEPQVEPNADIEETRKILKEELGVVTKDDLQKFQEEIQSQQQADQQLKKVVSQLDKKFSGDRGEPKFSYPDLEVFIQEKYAQTGYPTNIDIQAEYFDMNQEFYSQLPKVKANVAQTERRTSVPFSLEKKKIRFEPTGKDEVSAEDAAREYIRNLENT